MEKLFTSHSRVSLNSRKKFRNAECKWIVRVYFCSRTVGPQYSLLWKRSWVMLDF